MSGERLGRKRWTPGDMGLTARLWQLQGRVENSKVSRGQQGSTPTLVTYSLFNPSSTERTLLSPNFEGRD